MSEIGHNNPPDPIDLATEPFGDLLSEVENWTDGKPVDNEPAMKSVDVLIKEMKSAKTALASARKDVTDPLHKAWKSEVARWKPTEDDFQRRIDCLVAIVAPFKARLLAEKEAARQEAARKAREAEEEARRAALEAAAGDLEAQAEADRKKAAYEAERKRAEAARKDTVKGMRKVTRVNVTDMRALLTWLSKDATARPLMEEWATDYARRNHKSFDMAGVVVTEEREAF